MVVREQRKKIQNGRKRDKWFEGEGAALAEGNQIEQWRYTSWRSSRSKSQCL